MLPGNKCMRMRRHCRFCRESLSGKDFFTLNFVPPR